MAEGAGLPTTQLDADHRGGEMTADGLLDLACRCGWSIVAVREPGAVELTGGTKVRQHAAMRRIVERTGLSISEVSSKTGHNRGYVSGMLNKHSGYSVQTLGEMADACGFDLLARDRRTGSTFAIDWRP